MSRMMLPLCLILAAVPALAVEPPSPLRELDKHVRVDAIKGGYQIQLSVQATETLRDGLAIIADGKTFAELARQFAKKLEDPELEKKIDLLAIVVQTQAPLLRKALDDKAGPNGTIIKVFGVERKLIPEPPPAAKAIGAAFLPKDVQDRINGVIAVANTTPLLWRVEPRK